MCAGFHEPQVARGQRRGAVWKPGKHPSAPFREDFHTSESYGENPPQRVLKGAAASERDRIVASHGLRPTACGRREKPDA